MTSLRIPRNFLARSVADQAILLHASWCEHCELGDFALLHPEEYEIDGEIFLSGFCPHCSSECTTEIIEHPGHAQ